MHRKKQTYNIAIVGVTGIVGQVFLSLLENSALPINQLIPIASDRSSGKSISFNKEPLPIITLEEVDFKGIDIAFFSAGSEISAVWAPRAAKAGALVIDNTSHFRYQPTVPLVIPEINPHALSTHQGIIANPNCSTIQMLVALYPLHRTHRLTRIDVSTYQSVSGTGKKAIQELLSQTSQLLASGKNNTLSCNSYPVPIAFNLIPHIDAFQENGYTKEEMKMILETQKIFEDLKIAVNPTCVRVPVLFGHSEVVRARFERALHAQEALEILKKTPGIVVVNEEKPSGYPTPRTHAEGSDSVFIGRVRQDLFDPHALNLWITSDNTRKGGATNSVQIVLKMLEMGLI